MVEEGPEGLDGEVVVGSFDGGPFLSGGRSLGGVDDGVPEAFGSLGVMVSGPSGAVAVAPIPDRRIGLRKGRGTQS